MPGGVVVVASCRHRINAVLIFYIALLIARRLKCVAEIGAVAAVVGAVVSSFYPANF